MSDDNRHRDRPCPRLKQKYNDEVKGALKTELGLNNVMQVPTLEKIVINMGVGRATQQPSLLEGRRRRPHRDQRAEADRHQGHASRSPASSSVRASRSAARSRLRGDRMWEFLDRLVAVAIPRIRDFRGLPATQLGRPGQLHVRPRRADRVPGDRLRQDRRTARHGHHHRHHRRRPTSRARRCSTRSASRSSGTPTRGSTQEASAADLRWQGCRQGEEEVTEGQRTMAKKSLINKADAKPKYKVRGYTRCRRCGRARSVYRKFGLCRVCLRRWPTPARSPA